MQRLGLLPPYSVEDVKRAYRHLAKSAHPDQGGDPAEFAGLHEAYERAVNLARFHESRKSWLGERVERYAERVQFVDDLAQAGGRCLLQRPDIYLSDYGPDFAQILCEVVAIYLTEHKDADAVLARCAGLPVFQEVRLLDLSHSSVSNDGLKPLAESNLCGLDLRQTSITAAGLRPLQQVKTLEWVHVGQTRVGLWGRMRLRQSHPDWEVVTEADAEQPDFDSLQYRQSKLMQRLAEIRVE